jgi:hypothetical protein
MLYVVVHPVMEFIGQNSKTSEVVKSIHATRPDKSLPDKSMSHMRQYQQFCRGSLSWKTEEVGPRYLCGISYNPSPFDILR